MVDAVMNYDKKTKHVGKDLVGIMVGGRGSGCPNAYSRPRSTENFTRITTEIERQNTRWYSI